MMTSIGNNDNKDIIFIMDWMRFFFNILGQQTPRQFGMADCMKTQKEIMELDAAVFIALT